MSVGEQAQPRILVQRLDFAIYLSLLVMAVCIPLTETGKSIALVAALSFWAMKMGVTKHVHVTIPLIGYFFLGWLGVVALSSLFSNCGFFTGISDVLFYTLSFFLIVNTIQGEEKVWGIIWAILLGIGLGSLLGFYQFFYVGTTSDRLSIGSLGFTAAYLSMIFSLLIGLWLHNRFATRESIYLGMIALVSAIALGYTHTRSMWVAVFCILAMGATLYRKWIPVAMGAIFVVVFGGVALLNPHIQNRLHTSLNPLEDPSFVGRFAIWEASMRMFQANPVLGVGQKCFKPNRQRYQVPENHGQGHNVFFHTAAELGSIGLIGLLSWMGGYVHFLIKMKSRLQSQLSQALWFTSLGCFLTIILGGLIDSILGSEVSLLFMIITGLLIVEERNVLAKA